MIVSILFVCRDVTGKSAAITTNYFLTFCAALWLPVNLCVQTWIEAQESRRVYTLTQTHTRIFDKVPSNVNLKNLANVPGNL